MRLREFIVGDKVYYAPGKGPRHMHSEILFIGEQHAILKNWRGEEFVREVDADGFEHWPAQPDIQELRELGFDLFTAIRDASPDYLIEKTPHMKAAMENWAART